MSCEYLQVHTTAYSKRWKSFRLKKLYITEYIELFSTQKWDNYDNYVYLLYLDRYVNLNKTQINLICWILVKLPSHRTNFLWDHSRMKLRIALGTLKFFQSTVLKMIKKFSACTVYTRNRVTRTSTNHDPLQNPNPADTNSFQFHVFIIYAFVLDCERNV